MADDWESAADEEEVAVPVNRWEGEDEDEPIAEAWDADPDEAAAKRKAEAAAAANKPPPAPVVSARKKKLAAEEEKKRLEKEVQQHTAQAHTAAPCRAYEPAVFLALLPPPIVRWGAAT